MNAAILSIGDEILIGQVINTNAAFLSKKLFREGIHVTRILTVPDMEKDIIAGIGDAFKSAGTVISTGGLGPTHDDITVKCISKYFKKKLLFHEPTYKRIKAMFERRGLAVPENIDEQSMMPEGAEILSNTRGTAPGILIRSGNKVFCALPGVPHEMESMTIDSLLPRLRSYISKTGKRKFLMQKTLHTIGIAEALLSQKLGALDKILISSKDSSVKLAFLPSNYEVRLRITVAANKRKKAEQLMNSALKKIKTRVKNYIYSYDENPLEYEVGKLLIKRKLTVSAAESCTGGLVASKLTNVPGSSDYFIDGVVSYSYTSKENLLGVKPTTLKKFGAVSEQTAIEMAEGIRKTSKTDIGISTTGIAGPAGATKTKPVGLVWIGYTDKKKSFAKSFIFTKDRLRNKEIMSKMALEIIRREMLQI